MSGAEALALLGAISSIIQIVDGTKQVYDAATNAQGLPEAFRDVAGRLPVIKYTLDSAQKSIEYGVVDEVSCESVKHVVLACKIKAQKLDELFQKTLHTDGTSTLERYYKAVKILGKGNRVEELMRRILEDLQVLACERGMRMALESQPNDISKAIAEVSAIPSSVPEKVFHETIFTPNNLGSGTYYNAQGDMSIGNHSDSRSYNSGGGSMIIGQKNFYANIPNGSTLQASKADEAQACLTAIFLTNPIDDRERLKYLKGTRIDGTCTWIKAHELYKSWLSSQSQLLWLSGDPGKGKTMLSIFLSEELEEIAKTTKQAVFLPYFCDNRDEKRNTSITVIRGLIFQLLSSQPKLFDHILPSFKTQKSFLFTAQSFETLWRIFESMLRDPVLGPTYCIVDGLDECEQTSLGLLITRFKGLFTTQSQDTAEFQFKLIITSRDLSENAPEILLEVHRINLDTDARSEINDDIDRFINVKVDELTVCRQYPEKLRTHVETIFRKRARGTFLWVGVVANALKKYRACDVEEALDRFPPGLEDIYARILLQIDVDKRKIAADILRWMIMAIRPLTLSELSTGIGNTDRPSEIFSSRDEITQHQLSYCGDLLIFKEDEVTLLHQSVKDYLLREKRDPNPELEFFRIKKEAGNLEISRKCLDSLQKDAVVNVKLKKYRDEDLEAFPLLSYAATNWLDHARTLPRQADIFDLSIPFYQRKSRYRTGWLMVYWPQTRAFYFDCRPPRSLLHLACHFGLLPLVEKLLLGNSPKRVAKRLLFLNITDEQGKTALHWAAIGGHKSTMSFLLEQGAEVKAKDRSRTKSGSTALHFAAQLGHQAVVQLLLDNGARVDAKCKRLQQTALYLAARGNREAVVRLLLENGANPNARSSDGYIPLHTACSGGNTTVAGLLLDKGANIEARCTSAQLTALHLAARQDAATVRLLLARGADIEAKTMSGTSALHLAAGHRDESMALMLLEMGANTMIKDNSTGQTALHNAARLGRDAVVQLMIKKGASFEDVDNYGKKPYDSATEVLREGRYETPAEARGLEIIISLLKPPGLSETSDPEAQPT